MKLLIVVSTPMEIAPTLKHHGIKNTDEGNLFKLGNNITVVISGVGMTAAAYWTGKILEQDDCDLAINAGIAGSFDMDIPLGEVVAVKSDIIADLGAQNGDGFIPMNELGFAKESEYTFKIKTYEWPELKSLRVVKAVSVNTVSGQQRDIERLQRRLNPDIESMEGAGFHLACQNSGVASYQLRAISNYVEERDRDNWDISLAVQRLNVELQRIIAQYR